MTDKVPKQKIVPVNFLRVIFSLLDFLTLEAGIDRLFEMSVWNYHSALRNISEERGSHVTI
jgi:hypothetical protein